jgi:DNA-binding NtrC family response regulator
LRERAVVDLNEKASIRVLHVDDEPSFLRTAKQCLEVQGQLEVENALSVEEAIRKITEKRFDVVISDYQMPGKNGLAFLKELRESGNTIPFIIFTGKGREEVAIKALNYGADHYFSKIGDAETVYCKLAHGIRQAVERKRAEEMLRESEEKYRNLVENSKDSIAIIDLNGNVARAQSAGLHSDIQGHF